jgi:hypothetical protein
VPFRDGFEVGEVALFVEEFGEDGDLFVDGFACELTFNDIDHLAPPTIEDAPDKSGFFGFHVPEELDWQAFRCRGEKRLSERCGAVPLGRAARVPVIFVGRDEPGGAQGGEVLTDGARRNFECDCEFVRGGFTVTFDDFKHMTLRRRQINGMLHAG